MIFPIYQLYLLQLEEYNLARYWNLILKSGYLKPKRELRKEIAWTPKTISIFIIAVLAYILSVYLFFTSNLEISAIITVLFYPIALPLVYSFITLIIYPLDLLTKKIIVKLARKKIRNKKNLQIIGVAGSYGKTTMKNVLASVLSEKFITIFTPASINTPVGISRWILRNLKEKTEILIIEMGEHYRGDIKYLCSITKPTISVVTGINEAHLERLGKIEDSVETIFEVVKHAKKNAPIILNADDKNVAENHQKHSGNKKAFLYSSRKNNNASLKLLNKSFDNNELVWRFNVKDYGELESSLLGEYGIGCITGTILVGEALGMDMQEIKEGIKSVKPIEHRLQPIRNKDILVIDDSYNGNPDGAKEAINLLSRFRNNRKIYLTPGLVEAGKKTKEVHVDIGKQLAHTVDKVILIKNSVTPFIEEGLKKASFSPEDIIWFDTAQDAHNSLSGIIKGNDVILFQNDWGDQYL